MFFLGIIVGANLGILAAALCNAAEDRRAE
jgi:hypothetical protein